MAFYTISIKSRSRPSSCCHPEFLTIFLLTFYELLHGLDLAQGSSECQYNNFRFMYKYTKSFTHPRPSETATQIVKHNSVRCGMMKCLCKQKRRLTVLVNHEIRTIPCEDKEERKLRNQFHFCAHQVHVHVVWGISI